MLFCSGRGKIIHNGDAHTGISAYLGQGEDAESHQTVDLLNYPRAHSIEGAALLRVRFTNGEGQPASTLRLTEVLGVEVDLQVKKAICQFNLSMAVVHGDGFRVFSEAYSDEHALPDLAPGEYTLRFHVPMRFFKMESYFLSLTVVENGNHCDSVDGLLMPEIINENPNLQMESLRWGVVRIPVTWDLIQPAMKIKIRFRFFRPPCATPACLRKPWNCHEPEN